MENTVRYKQFDITLKVEVETGLAHRYRIFGKIRRVENETEQQAVRTWLTSAESASENAAYEFGLQEAREWIDEHAQDG